MSQNKETLMDIDNKMEALKKTEENLILEFEKQRVQI